MLPSYSVIVLLSAIVHFERSIALPVQQISKSRSRESDIQLRTSRQAVNIEVIARDVPKEMEDEVVKFVKEVLAKHGSGSAGVSEIGRKMDAKYGPYWQVFSYSADANMGAARHSKQHIQLEVNKETGVLIYQTENGF
uniref:Uncharacterized protein n=1 Tax=Plectus sambesii TaxID=2011161 RepID=A0A914WEV5_9BILA